VNDPDIEDSDWPQNYFNYFTEIEEHFQRARGTGLFLLSPLDWALIENWRTADVPLEAVLKGIDETFEKWRARKVKRRKINSLDYCAQEVMEHAHRTAPARNQKLPSEAPFTVIELREHLKTATETIRSRSDAPFQAIASSLGVLTETAEAQIQNLEDLERRLTALEEKMLAAVRSIASEDDLYAIRESLDRELKPYRGKMTADQIALLERRYLDSALLDRAHLPRLSLFYLR
jgi:hypothetical protein